MLLPLRLYHMELFFLSKVNPPAKSRYARHPDNQHPIARRNRHCFENRLQRRIIDDDDHQEDRRNDGAEQIDIFKRIPGENRRFAPAVKHVYKLSQDKSRECNGLCVGQIFRIAVIDDDKR